MYSAIVPPFQTPDEFDHVARAYMLAHGDLVLHSEDGKASGGNVDTGLLNYMAIFRPLAGKYDRKLSTDEQEQAAAIPWSGATTRAYPTGTNYYFPVMYAPQALGLAVGEGLGLPVSQAYRLSRYMTLACIVGLLWFAFQIFPPPAAVVGILLLPMGMFLTTGITLDAITTATAVVGLSAFMRVITQGRDTPRWIVWSMVVAMGLVCASRANALPFLLLLFGAWWVTRERKLLISSVTCTAVALAWTLISIKRTVYRAGDPHAVDHAGRLMHFVAHPGDFLGILYATITNKPIQSYYLTSYIGSLGWLDSSFAISTYYILGLLLIGTVVFGLSRDALAEHRVMRVTLVVCSAAMILLTFLAMLVQWTIGMPDVIQGVQGRYFIIPSIAVVYALTADARPRQSAMERISAVLVVALALVSIYATTRLLIIRYYAPSTQAGATVKPVLAPSLVLTSYRPITLHFPADVVADPAPLNSLEIMFGTYGRINHGEGKIELWTSKGERFERMIDLKDVGDNAYLSILLDGKSYMGGQVTVTGGEGISSWETHLGDEAATTCMKFHYKDGTTRTIMHCPQM